MSTRGVTVPAGGRRGDPRSGRARRLYTIVVFVVLASLDNTAVGLMPPLYGVMGRDLGVSESALGVVTAAMLLLTAVTAVVWGYIGDRSNRKAVLLVGTAVWVVGVGGTGLAGGFAAVLAGQVLAAVGLGAIASVGFSVVSDLVSPRRRGLAMSFWGLSQGAGTLLGTLGAGLLGAGDWRRPFLLLAVAGLATALAYLLAEDTPRGSSEPELAKLFADGDGYQHRIHLRDLPGLVGRRTNVWLVLQGLTAQFAYGSLVWLPRLFQAKIEALGHSLETATTVGSMFAVLFQLGGVLSILGGVVGDRWQRRDPRGRALLSMIGILGAIPFYVVLFFLPLRVELPQGEAVTPVDAFLAVATSLATEPTVWLSFVVALLALMLTSADSPNWFALIGDVNLPEHRGTVYGAGNLVNGVGRALGNGLVGVTFGALVARFPPPLNYALGLALFQVFFLPTGWCYWQAAKSSPKDVATVRALLLQRAATQGGAATPQGIPPSAPHPSPSADAAQERPE